MKTFFTIRNLLIGTILLFILERLYIFIPFNISLDTKPTSQRTASYLATTISRHANCSIQLIDAILDAEKDATFLAASCNINKSSFSIYIFYDQKEKKDFINKVRTVDKNNRLYSPCFKKGSYYIICATPTFSGDRYTSQPNLPSKELYSRFPGTAIIY